MTLDELKDRIREDVYIEDDAMIDAVIAAVVANRLKIGDPVWMILIGASSGGKSQILRPIALTDERFFHKVDDITENTFLSGTTAKGGKDVSLLNRIGPHGMISISDLTILFSKNPESRNAILSQLRMLYDGEMVKMVGNKDKPISWKGYLGIIAGGTPSIYAGFEEVADMGERFLCYRMKKYDEKRAARTALSRTVSGKELDKKISEVFLEYIKEKVSSCESIPELSQDHMDRIIDIAMISERVRAVTKIDKYTKETERITVPAMPMRTTLQLASIAKALIIMHGRDLEDSDMRTLEWIGISLASEEKRECLRVLSEYEDLVNTSLVADGLGLDTRVVRAVLQNLASTGIVQRTGDSNSLQWKIDYKYIDIIRRIFGTEVRIQSNVFRDTAEEEKKVTDEDF